MYRAVRGYGEQVRDSVEATLKADVGGGGEGGGIIQKTADTGEAG